MEKLIYKLPPKSIKKDFAFNVFGSMINAAVSVILLVVVSHISGDNKAGIFSLAYSTAQMMYTISVFEMRNIQVTDAKNEYSFGSVFAFRILSTIGMYIFFIVFAIAKNFSGEKLTLMILLSAYMTVLSFSDLFQGSMHLGGYLHLAGKSLGFQVLISAVVFSIALIITKNLIIATILMIIVAIIWMLAYDIPFSRNFSDENPKFDLSIQKSIFLCAMPLFLSSFMHQYIFNAPKYAIDDLLTPVEQSHYGYLVMPAFFINLFSIFVFRPQLVPLSQNWTKRKYKAFTKTVIMLFGWIAIVTIAAIGVGYFLGIPVLEIMYSADLSGKRGMLLILLVAGAFSACCSLTSNLITIMRKQKYCLVAYSLTFIVSMFLPQLLVSRIGMLGATIAYLIEMALLFIVMFIFFVIVFLKTKGANENE